METVTCHPSGGFCDVSSVCWTCPIAGSLGKDEGNLGVTAPARAASSCQHDVTEVALGRDAQLAPEPVPTPPAVRGDGSSTADGGGVGTGFCGPSPPLRWAQAVPLRVAPVTFDTRHLAPEPTAGSFRAADPGSRVEGQRPLLGSSEPFPSSVPCSFGRPSSSLFGAPSHPARWQPVR